MKSILVIEPLSDGHRAVYASRLAEGLAANGWQVHIAITESASKHLEFKKFLSGNQIKMHLFPDELFGDLIKRQNILGLIKREFGFRKIFGEIFETVVESNEINLVFVPYFDYCLHAVSLLGSPFGRTPWAGITMRPAFHYATMGMVAPKVRMAWLRKQLFFRLLRQKSLRNLFSIDESLCNYMARFHSELTSRLVYLADPADCLVQRNKVEARKALGIPLESSLIMVFGAISLRKGICNLLAATKQMEFPQTAHILLAGKQSEEVKSWLKGSQVAQELFLENRLHVIDRFLDENQQSMAFSASNIVWLGYRNHFGMSGVLVQAGYMGLPVIADECGLIGWYTINFSLGIKVNSSNALEVALAVKKLIENNEFASACGENGAQLFIENTFDKFICKVAENVV